MKALVQQWGYTLDSDYDIWLKPEYKGIAYSDGDEVEARLLAAVQQTTDLSVLSTELHVHCIDWPSLYHLSSARANIMRPFAGMLKGDILEIGAGCGAITRYLGESGANILALEGSPRRAHIARTRVRDLDNVTVLTDCFEQFRVDYQFDVITLIGVLEYANLFCTAQNPPLAMLQRVQSLLKPNGKLIIAIENQLGLKYFAGAPEDHLGWPMIGIEGRYQRHQPQTFGRHVLKKMLNQTHFGAIEFLAPFPDYKLPVSIITEKGFASPDFDPAAFVWQSVRRDPQLPTYCNFSLELAWPEVIDNQLGMDLSNSFLIIASPNAEPLIDPSILTYHYTTDRLADYCKETVFQRDENSGAIRIQYKRLNRSASTRANALLNFVLPGSDTYVLGKTLSHQLLRIVTNEGWLIEQVADFVKDYLAILQYFAKLAGLQVALTSPYAQLPGDFFDMIPSNIIIDADGVARSIDKEWQLATPIEVGHLLFRSFQSLLNATTKFGKPEPLVHMTRYEFIDRVFTVAGLPLQKEDYSRYALLEAEIQHSVTGYLAERFMAWGENFPVITSNQSQALMECNWTVEALRQTIAEQDTLITALNQPTADRNDTSSSWKKLLCKIEFCEK